MELYLNPSQTLQVNDLVGKPDQFAYIIHQRSTVLVLISALSMNVFKFYDLMA